MKLGAQLYSLRTFTQNPQDLKDTVLKVKAMGYRSADALRYDSAFL